MPSSRQQRSDEAKAWRSLYKTKAWRALRLQVLVEAGWRCEMCPAVLRGRDAQVDHVTPHKGNRDLFFDRSNLQALCARCHGAAKQREERQGFASVIGEDGWPTDPRHPANTGKLVQ